MGTFSKNKQFVEDKSGNHPSDIGEHDCSSKRDKVTVYKSAAKIDRCCKSTSEYKREKLFGFQCLNHAITLFANTLPYPIDSLIPRSSG